MNKLIAALMGLAAAAPALAQLKPPPVPEKLFYMETSISTVKYAEPGLTLGRRTCRVPGDSTHATTRSTSVRRPVPSPA